MDGICIMCNAWKNKTKTTGTHNSDSVTDFILFSIQLQLAQIKKRTNRKYLRQNSLKL